MELKRVVVTGLGAITPIGNTIDEYWNGLINGVSGADMITLFNASKFKTKFACEIKGFEPTAFLEKKEARKIDRFTPVSYTHLRAHETPEHLVCRLLLEKKKKLGKHNGIS